MKKLFAGLGVLLVAVAALAWSFRTDLLLAFIHRSSEIEVAAFRPVPWQTGPQMAQEVAPASGPDKRPNIIFILADDLGINDIQTFGGDVANSRVPTPGIGRLAKGGVTFTQAYAGNATCAPSRAMLMTGRYPTRHGFEFTPTPPGMSNAVSLMGNEMDTGLPPIDYNDEVRAGIPEYNDQGLPGSEVTIAEVLKASGYHTAHIGKWHLGLGSEYGPNAQGFDESLLMSNGLHLPEDDAHVVNAALEFDPIDRFLWARMRFAAQYNEGELFAPGGYLTDWWTDEAINVIRNNRNRPFFLYLAHWAVHTPLQATKDDFDAVGDIEPHRLRVYAAMVRALDRSVGRIMAELDTLGLTDNSLVVFSSDNGGAGYIGIPDVNAPYRGWKMTFFEGGIRAPLLLHWPAAIAAGQAVDSPVAHIDLMPTFAAAAGTTPPSDRIIDGVNLVPAATGTGPVIRPNDALFWQSGYYQAVRRGDWKLQVDGREGKKWLFNLAEDPTEQTNLAAEEHRMTAELTTLLERHQAGRTPPRYPFTVESPTPIDKTRAEKVEPGDEYIWWPN
ncbi:MAG: sulfatase [Gammaproteobacteria bacterium]|nr:sulfatase [Gammaproteobacteria bacterium]